MSESCRFVLDRNRLYVGLATSCLICGTSFCVGGAAWAMRIDTETIGYLCPDCLTPAARFQVEAEGDKASSIADEGGLP